MNIEELRDILSEILPEGPNWKEQRRAIDEAACLLAEVYRAGFITDDGEVVNPRQIGEAVAYHYRILWTGVGGRVVPATDPHGLGLSREPFVDTFELLPELLKAAEAARGAGK